MIQEKKRALREKLKKVRAELGNKKEKHTKIQAKLENLPEFKNAKTILLYHSTDEEVSTIELIDKYIDKKFIVLPRVEGKELELHHIAEHHHIQKGAFNICEPKFDRPVVDTSTVELAIIPGLAFDENRYRMGFGRGFYDRLLKNVKAPKIALAYEAQIVEDVPREEHDEKVDLIITEDRIIR